MEDWPITYESYPGKTNYLMTDTYSVHERIDARRWTPKPPPEKGTGKRAGSEKEKKKRQED